MSVDQELGKRENQVDYSALPAGAGSTIAPSRCVRFKIRVIRVRQFAAANPSCGGSDGLVP